MCVSHPLWIHERCSAFLEDKNSPSVRVVQLQFAMIDSGGNHIPGRSHATGVKVLYSTESRFL